MEWRAQRVAVLVVMVVGSILVGAAPLSAALATAESFGVTDAQGARGTNVVVPVSIANVQNGPILSLIFDLQYDKHVIDLVDIQKGDLTIAWDEPAFNTAFTWGARFALVYDGVKGLENGATGSVLLLNFSILGEPGASSKLNLTNIQLAGPDYQVGSAPARNGTFTIWPRIGDMNGDRHVDMSDVIALLRHVSFGDPVYDDPDVNSDGTVNADDVVALALHVYFGDPIYP